MASDYAAAQADAFDVWRDYARCLSADNAERGPGAAPDFFIIGPPEAGIESLAGALRRDRRFFLLEKESRYFSHVWREEPLTSYYARFREAGAAVRCGEATHSYFVLPEVAIRQIRQELPDLKLIIMLRDPAERAWAHACQAFKHKQGWFRGASGDDPSAVAAKDWYGALVHPSARAFQDYAGPLSRWLRHFAPQQTLLLPVERLATEPAAVQRDVCRFLDIGHGSQPSLLDRWKNPVPAASPPKPLAPLLDAIGDTAIADLTALVEGMPVGVAEPLRLAGSQWKRPHFAKAKHKLPKLDDKRPRLAWDAWTRRHFSPEMLAWAARSAGAPPDRERLSIAALNFDLATQPLDNGSDPAAGVTSTSDGASTDNEGVNGHIVERHRGRLYVLDASRRPSESQATADDRASRIISDADLHRVAQTRTASPGHAAVRNGASEPSSIAGPENGTPDDEAVSSAATAADGANEALVASAAGDGVSHDAVEQWRKHLRGIEAALSGSARMLENILARASDAVRQASAAGTSQQDDGIAGSESSTASADTATHQPATAPYGAQIDAALASRDERAAALEAAVSRIGGEAARLWAATAAMDSRLADRDARIADLEDALAGVEERLRGASTAAQAAAIEAGLAQSDGRIAAIEAGLAQSDERAAAIEAGVAQSDERVAALEAAAPALTEVQAGLVQRDERITALEMMLAAEILQLRTVLDDRIAETRQQSSELETALAGVAATAGEAAELSAELRAAYDKRVGDLEAALNDVATEAPRLSLALSTRLDESDKQIGELESELTLTAIAAKETALASDAQTTAWRAEHGRRLSEFAATLRDVVSQMPRWRSSLDTRLAQYGERVAIAEERLTQQDAGLSRISDAIERERERAIEREQERAIEREHQPTRLPSPFSSFPPSLDLLYLLFAKDGVRRVGASLAISSDIAAGHFLYGPYLSIAPGTYTLEIQFSATQVRTADQPVLTIEVAMEQQILSNVVVPCQVSAQPIRMHFTIPERPALDPKVEFRFSHHNNAELEISSVRLRLAQPHVPEQSSRGRRLLPRSWRRNDRATP